jgi:hypothetical protein
MNTLLALPVALPLLAAAALAAVVIPLVALAAVNDWWFFGVPGTPEPVKSPVVVTKGSWNGHAWQLVAYNSQGEGTCWSVTFEGTASEPGGRGVTLGPGVLGRGGSMLGCGSIVGMRLPHIHEQLPTVTYMAGSNADGSIRWIAGPVVASAAKVVVRFREGAVLELRTFAPSSSLGNLRWFHEIRFFVGRLPSNVEPDALVQSITGYSVRGKPVACLLYGKSIVGYPNPSDCVR